MNFCIVVARYNESVKWTKQFSNVIIYNKGHELTNDYNQILLNNVGKEGHSYYKYIYDNYNNLADFTIFLQGNPFDHSRDIISKLNNYLNNKDLSIDFEFLSDDVHDCNLSGCIHHPGLPLVSTYETLFGEKKEKTHFKFGAGAQFIVSKKKILERPKSFYLKICEMLGIHKNPKEGYVIERFHKLIFN